MDHCSIQPAFKGALPYTWHMLRNDWNWEEVHDLFLRSYDKVGQKTYKTLHLIAYSMLKAPVLVLEVKGIFRDVLMAVGPSQGSSIQAMSEWRWVSRILKVLPSLYLSHLLSSPLRCEEARGTAQIYVLLQATSREKRLVEGPEPQALDLCGSLTSDSDPYTHYTWWLGPGTANSKSDLTLFLCPLQCTSSSHSGRQDLSWPQRTQRKLMLRKLSQGPGYSVAVGWHEWRLPGKQAWNNSVTPCFLLNFSAANH